MKPVNPRFYAQRSGISCASTASGIGDSLIPSASFFLGLSALALVIQSAEYLLPYFPLLLYLVIALFVFVSKQLFLVAFVSVLVLSNDITPKEFDATTFYDVSVFSFSVPSLIVIVLLSIAVLSIFFSKKKADVDCRMPKSLFILVIMIIYGLALGLASSNSFRELANDTSIFLTPASIAFFMYRLFLSDWQLVFKTLTTALTAKCAVAPLNFIFGYGEAFADTLVVMIDSVRNVTPLLLLWAIALLWQFPGDKRIQLWGLVVLASAGFVSINSASRTNIVLFILSLIIFIWTLNRTGVKILSLKKCLRIIRWLFIIIIITTPVIITADVSYFLWKLNSFVPSLNDLGSTNASSSVRLLEAINVYDHLDRNSRIFLGMGFGGYFQDRLFPFAHLFYDTTTYRSEWIDAGTLYKPHTFPVLLFLKLGLFGVILVAYFFWYIVVRWKRLRKISCVQEKIVMAVLCSGLLVLFYKSFNLKLQLICGIVLFLFLALERQITHRAKGKSGV